MRRLPNLLPESGKITANTTLYNSIVVYLGSIQPPVGWTNGQEHSAGVSFVKALRGIFMDMSNSLWQQLTDRHQPEAYRPPAELAALFGHKDLTNRADRPAEQARSAIPELGQLLQQPPAYLTRSSWQPVLVHLNQLQKALLHYTERLSAQQQRQQQQREAEADLAAEGSMSSFKGASWEGREALQHGRQVKQAYEELDAALQQKQPYEPLCLLPFMEEAEKAAGTPSGSLTYLKGLQLSMDCMVWTHAPGGRQRNTTYVWRVDSNPAGQSSSGAGPSSQPSISSRAPPNWQDSRCMRAALECSRLVEVSANEQLLSKVIKRYSRIMPTSSTHQLRALAADVLGTTGVQTR